MLKKVKITFVVHNELQKELSKQMVEKNYGLRGKSKWVSEAIELLLNMSNYPELVNLSGELKNFEKVESIVVDPSLKKKLDETIVQIRKEYPALEGVQSRIIRTAIMQKILR